MSRSARACVLASSTSRRGRRWIAPLALSLLVLAGCPDEPRPPMVDGGTGGSGGSGGRGGAGGSGGAGGTGGRPADARPDRGPDGRRPDGPVADGGNAGVGLDACFAGLRAGRGSFQLATKASADGKVRMRIALETGDRFGTSGSYAWEPIRLGLEVDGTNVCVTSEAELAAAYTGTRHNCGDALDITVDGRRYLIRNPDTRTGAVGRDMTSVSVFMGTATVLGPTMLTTSSCTTKITGMSCLSGGPC
jgi:hypothetical protein